MRQERAHDQNIENTRGDKGFRVGKRGGAFGHIERRRRGSVWIQREIDRETLGIAPRGVEWGGMCERSQHIGQRKQNQLDNGRTGSEGR